MADEQPNNQRAYEAYCRVGVALDPAQLTAYQRARIDAVVAAVKEREGEWRRQAIRHAKAIVRRDIARAIRADTDRAEWALDPQEHAARIAEGNTDRG